ncbi:MAG TPA: hypothetical protein VFK14_11725 [Solirubrobacterales bacterium]|nr:hypothetical protein [Solirubrobacterales bacterium]
MARAAPSGPAWHLDVISVPTNLVPEAAPGSQGFFIVATNVGAADTAGTITVSDSLPAGLSPEPGECEALGQTVTCTVTEIVHPGDSISKFVPVAVSRAVDGVPLQNAVTISGAGGATAEASVETEVGAPAPAFGFLTGSGGLEGLLSEPNGAPASQAGALPYQLTVDIGFPSGLKAGKSTPEPVNDGHPRDISVDLPPGLVVDPAATPRCRAAQFELQACPPGSQIGVISVATAFSSLPALLSAPLYNVVPPSGSASDFGFRLTSGEFGVSGHLLGSLRAGEYDFTAATSDIPISKFPLLGVQIQLWGKPSDPAHDVARGGPAEPQEMPLIAMPAACGPLGFTAATDSWEEPGSFVTRSVPLQGLSGDPIEAGGCSLLEFDPALSIQPTTTTADSPTGLEVDIHAPQRLGANGLMSASLQRAAVALPAGLVLNPAAAGGRGACTAGEIGLLTAVGTRDARFDGSPSACPDAAKVGTAKLLTPLLGDEPQDGQPAPHPLTGSIYLAQPYENPFASLFAIYVAIEDPGTGVVAKLGGEIRADPETGRLTAVFDGIPQVPFEDFDFDFFGGSRAPLRTPSACGTSASLAELAPWSGTAAASEEDRFSVTTSPDGGACAASADRQPNAPRFEAGSVLPMAGRHSPFVLRLQRDDGSQELRSLEVTLPPGLSGRLRGVFACPEGLLAGAATRSGRDEEANPSCPSASRVGRVVVGVGAGPSPYHGEGEAYLAGPYRGAPLSLAVVTPAVAGPFDLGTVVVRAGLYLDARTGQITARSDQLPSVLDGVPLDVRSIVVEINRSDLILNPTSCEPMELDGKAVSTAGTVAGLRDDFQVGGCDALPFKPRLSLRFRGAVGRNGHPALRAVLRTDPEGAALAGAAFVLPPGELLDLRHLRSLCPTRLSAERCPRSSRLGRLHLESPLLEDPLEGPVYLRLPRHRLPTLTAALRSGQLRFLLGGSTFHAHRHLGIRLRSLPDIPLSKAVLSLAGGRQGIFVNSRALCSGVGVAGVSLTAHSGKHRHFRVRPRFPRRC